MGPEPDPTASATPAGYFPTLRRRSPARWTALRLFTLYRLVLSSLFFVMSLVPNSVLLETSNPRLFAWSALTYAAVSAAWALAAWIERRGFQTQVELQVLFDVLFLTLLMHASGGVGSGIGMLMIVSIATTSLLTEGRLALSFAALGSVALLTEFVFRRLQGVEPVGDPTQAGLLGVTLFATALLSHLLARRARESEALAAQRGIDLANLSRLNEQIIQRMQSGVIVLDGEDRVRLMNAAASEMLGAPSTGTARLDRIAPLLQTALAHWREGEETSMMLPAISESGDVQVRFRMLGGDQQGGTLIYLDDITAVSDRLQQRKLASLGRLVASIAHEIRNPLGAISHAAQLLEESPALGGDEQQLTAIIKRHGMRMNEIVGAVLQLSRREPLQTAQLELVTWLQRFVAEFVETEQLPPEQVRLLIEDADLGAGFDPGHLSQILANLCGNALRHGSRATRITLRAGRLAEGGMPYLDVLDDGPGIPEQIAEEIFEPFFTTKVSGTGLGLFIARELCDINNARLLLLRGQSGGAGFRILFATHLTQVGH